MTRFNTASLPASTGPAATSPASTTLAETLPESGSGCCANCCPEFAALVDPSLGRVTESTVAEVTAAASAIGSSIEVITASTNREIDTAFASLVQKRIDALWVSTSALFGSRRAQLVTLAAYHRMPAIYPQRSYTEVGGLMSYGTDILDSVRRGSG